MRNLEELNDKFKDKTCFIIGAGPSLATQDLSPLKNHITIAVNSGYLAYPSATYFLADDAGVKNWSYYFKDLKNSKTTIALLYEDKLKRTAPWFGERAILFRHRAGFELNSEYIHEEKSKRIFESRTATGSAIHVAYIAKCNPIILLGVDCCRVNGCRYFWQMPEYKGEKPYRNDGVKVDTYVRTKINGIESDKDLESILRYWNKIANILKEHNVKVLNASPISLVDCFEKVDLAQFV